ncbi:hypothetical protein FGO68_gene10677 [Halteria grandinella]|uniref:Uncharacterized protein n=1 Tax=Halteria grandinella TaxID=5974 RepID=A0A8J8P6F4_HALGN|nr:hypothetical protein FGO68_gene10677 [Halteria grandinella]
MEFYDKRFENDYEVPVFSPSFNRTGIQSFNFIKNSITPICLFEWLGFITLAYGLVYIILTYFLLNQEEAKLKKIWIVIAKGFVFLTKQFYFSLPLNCMVHFQRIIQDPKGEWVSTIYMSTFGLYCLAFPTYLIVQFIRKHPMFFRNCVQRQIFNSFLEDLRVPKRNHEIHQLWEVIKLIQFLLISIVSVVLIKYPVLVFTINIMLCALKFIFLGCQQPLKNGQWNEYIKEALFASYGLTMFNLTDISARRENMELLEFERDTFSLIKFSIIIVAMIFQLAPFFLYFQLKAIIIKVVQLYRQFRSWFSHYCKKSVRLPNDRYSYFEKIIIEAECVYKMEFFNFSNIEVAFRTISFTAQSEFSVAIIQAKPQSKYGQIELACEEVITGLVEQEEIIISNDEIIEVVNKVDPNKEESGHPNLIEELEQIVADDEFDPYEWARRLDRQHERDLEFYLKVDVLEEEKEEEPQFDQRQSIPLILPRKELNFYQIHSPEQSSLNISLHNIPLSPTSIYIPHKNRQKKRQSTSQIGQSIVFGPKSSLTGALQMQLLDVMRGERQIIQQEHRSSGATIEHGMINRGRNASMMTHQVNPLQMSGAGQVMSPKSGMSNESMEARQRLPMLWPGADRRR